MLPYEDPEHDDSLGAGRVETWLRIAAHLSSAAPLPAPPPLPPGTRLCRGRFVIGAMLGQGAMGAVYDVRDLERGADLALKTLLDTRSERLLAFKNEFRALQDLAHRNLVRLDELFEDDRRWFFTMERIRGVPFTSFVRPSGLDPQRLRQGLAELTRGLLALHGAGKIHRDIKPSNTLVEPDGRLVLLDFGLIGDARSDRQPLLPGAGTAAYMAPEQARGGGGRPADWYSVGVMLYQALTGELPFDGSPQTILERKLAEAAPSPSARAVDLPPDLDRLCQDLLRRDPGLRPDGNEVLRRLDGDATTPAPRSDGAARRFVGRVRELALLRQALAHAAEGRAVTAVISGASGVGKTALLDAFLGEQKRPVTVLSGRCYEREFVPFKALDGLIDALARHLDRVSDAGLMRLLPAGSPGLARIFPVLGQACRRAGLPVDDAEPASPTEARANAFRTLQELFAVLAADGPLVLAIDDLHWADVDSVSALEALFQGSIAANLLLVLLARSGAESPPVCGELVVTIELEALPAAEARELARHLLSERPEACAVDPGWLAEEAGRHPLFMEAMLRHGLAGGPDNVRLEDALAARVLSLADPARDLLDVVCIAAQPLSDAALAQATGLPSEPLLTLLRDLQADRLVLSRREGTERSVEPYHDQVRRAVLGCMPQERQLRCHRNVAEALEVLAPACAEALAVHWRAAGDRTRARVNAIRAGHHARRALAFDRAAAFYRSALDLPPGAGAESSELHRWLAEALAHAGRAIESAGSYRAAAVHAAGHERTELLRCAAEQLLRSGHFQEGLAAMDEILAPLGMRRPHSISAATFVMLRERLLEACEPILRRVAPLSERRARELARQADACWTTGLGLAGLDPIASAVFHSRHVRLSARLRDPIRLALGLCMRAPEGAFAGAPAVRARRTLERVQAVVRRLRGDPYVEGYQALAEGVVAFLLGDFDESLLHCEQAMARFRLHPGPVTWEMATAERFVLDCLWHTGRIGKLRQRTLAIWREATRRQDRYLVAQVETTVLPIVHLADDDVAAASAVLDRALADWPRPRLSMPHWQERQTRATVALYAGRPDTALQIMNAQLAAPEQSLFSRIKAVRVFSVFLHATALLGVAAQEKGDRRALLRQAARDVRRIARERISPDTVALLRGQIALLRGDRPEASAQLATAETLFARRGMKLLRLVATHGQGLVAGGPQASARVAEARARMLEEEIRRPEGFIRLFAPALADLT